MAVYYIGSYDIVNMELFKQYPPKVLALLPKYGGEVLASDIQAICLEGNPRTLNAIIRFPSEEAALGMFNDPVYQAEIRDIRRNSTANCTMVLVKEYLYGRGTAASDRGPAATAPANP
jgi:uncharacterized protein (DUF1330 family)